MNKLVFVLTVLLAFTLTASVHESMSVNPSVTIVIKTDGSIDPPSSPVSTIDKVTYTLTANTYNQSIYVERDNIIIDGNGHVLEGTYVNLSYGLSLSDVSNVTVRNLGIEAFTYGIFVDSGSNHEICGNNITNTVDAIHFQSSSNDTISGNIISTNSGWGVVVSASDNETVTRNNITRNHYGVWLAISSNDEICENSISKNAGDGIALYSVYYNGTFKSSSSNNINRNDIVGNGADGIKLLGSSTTNNTISANNLIENQVAIELNYSIHNAIYNNNFVDNNQQVLVTPYSTNTWNNGYPSGGNYWSDYAGTDYDQGSGQNITGSDGIGDSPYVISSSLGTPPELIQFDNYPLMGMFHSYNVTYYTPPLVSHFCIVTVISNSTISGFDAPIWIEHPEVIFLQFNATGLEGTEGFCRVSIPTVMMTGTYHVSINGTEIPHTLLACSDANTNYVHFTYMHSTEMIAIVPEFPPLVILSILMIATLSITLNHKRKH